MPPTMRLLAAHRFFHTMEKLCAIFPHNGKTLRIFSTLWKKVFHTVENFFLPNSPAFIFNPA